MKAITKQELMKIIYDHKLDIHPYLYCKFPYGAEWKMVKSQILIANELANGEVILHEENLNKVIGGK